MALTTTNPGLLGLELEVQRLSDAALVRQFALLHDRRELRAPGSVGEHRYRLLRDELRRRTARCA